MLKTSSVGLGDEETFNCSLSEFIRVKRSRKTFSFCSQVKSRTSIFSPKLDLKIENSYHLKPLRLFQFLSESCGNRITKCTVIILEMIAYLPPEKISWLRTMA